MKDTSFFQVLRQLRSGFFLEASFASKAAPESAPGSFPSHLGDCLRLCGELVIAAGNRDRLILILVIVSQCADCPNDDQRHQGVFTVGELSNLRSGFPGWDDRVMIRNLCVIDYLMRVQLRLQAGHERQMRVKG